MAFSWPCPNLWASPVCWLLAVWPKSKMAKARRNKSFNMKNKEGWISRSLLLKAYNINRQFTIAPYKENFIKYYTFHLNRAFLVFLINRVKSDQIISSLILEGRQSNILKVRLYSRRESLPSFFLPWKTEQSGYVKSLIIRWVIWEYSFLSVDQLITLEKPQSISFDRCESISLFLTPHSQKMIAYSVGWNRNHIQIRASELSRIKRTQWPCK